MTVEVVITIILVSVAAYILFSNFRKKSSGKCDCCNGSKSKRKLNR